MRRFMDRNFLLETKSARSLYHEVAAKEPIYDFHCHLSPKDIAENRKFQNLTEIWLGGDHYKWRQMRTAGIPERLITGDADPYEKFMAWTRTVERLAGNPLYHWTHLELQRYFGINEPLTSDKGPAVWKRANELLASEELSVRGIFSRMNVHAVGTTDDPADTLEHHRSIADGRAPIGRIPTRVLPSYRPDKALNIDLPGFPEYIRRLGAAADIEILSVETAVDALIKRLDHFVASGCRAADHALEAPPCLQTDDSSINAAFQRAMAGERVSPEEAEAWKTRVLVALSGAYARRDVAMQLHFAAIRNVNSRMYRKLGPDTGYDASHDRSVTASLAGLLDAMQEAGELPKTVLYTLNPKDYYPLGTLMGAFQGAPAEDADGIPGKIQLGSAWWFLDHKDGMEEQLKVLGNLGSLAHFVGMLTDSRSFLSYPRHEYFRRILCNLIGGWIDKGEFPAGAEAERIVADISFRNARRYFK